MVSGCSGAGVTSPTRWSEALVFVTTTHLLTCVRGCRGDQVMELPLPCVLTISRTDQGQCTSKVAFVGSTQITVGHFGPASAV
jgi:hypothetical protein